MRKVFIYGFLAALFFSITFVINKWLSVDKGGHWYWTASLRYIFVLILLSLLILFKYGIKHYTDTLKCFIDNFLFWAFAGGIGFGIFYLSLCYASSYSEGWVLATTWQSTILFTPLVIYLLGNKVKLYGVFYLAIMFMGVCLVNSYAFQKSDTNILHSILPILLSAICYPLGNTLCKYACGGKYKSLTINKFEISQNVFSQILMMVLGAMPVLILAWFIFKPYSPTITQIEFVFIVAILTGVIATSLLYKARQLAGTDSNALAFADGTQSLEAPLALFWEYSIFGGKLPNYLGFIGLTLLCLGIFMFYKSNLLRKGL
jgi:drug/metabolite transporter (DMT)-like permease